MKTPLAVAAFLLSVVVNPLHAAEPATAGSSIEQRFEKADLDIALKEYKKLRLAAVDLSLRLATERGMSDEERKVLLLAQSELEAKAFQTRQEALKKGRDDVAAKTR